MMEINRVDEESVMNNTTEVVEPGSGTVVMTPTLGGVLKHTFFQIVTAQLNLNWSWSLT